MISNVGTSSASCACARPHSGILVLTSSKYAELDDAAAAEGKARGKIWCDINLANLHENVLPTRERANLILTKGGQHRIEDVELRKL